VVWHRSPRSNPSSIQTEFSPHEAIAVYRRRRRALVARAGPRVSAAETVTVGIANSLTDVPFFIGNEYGFFKREGIDAVLKPFDSSSFMIAPLGTGALDVASGGVGASLYNAIARGIPMKVVADKGSARGSSYTAILVRSDLVRSGKVTSPKDLKGAKIAETGTGNSTSPVLDLMMRRYGMSYSDIQHVYMGFPEHVLGLQGGSIDASVTAEPVATQAVRSGVAVRFAGTEVYEPNQQLSVVFYGGSFIKNRGDIGVRFMTGYLRAVRYYNTALSGGHLKGKNGSAIVDVLTKYTSLKDRAVYEEAVAPSNSPYGKVNLESLAHDLAFYKSQGLIEGNAAVADVYDSSFVDAALKKLGPYRG
jgi:NitT/TauT family transport system substrate-binding protein